MLTHAAIFCSLATLVASAFTNPPFRNGLFHIGDVETIRYSTKFKEYSIALWQQSPQGGSANLGPILFQTKDGPQESFDWPVQTYDLDLKKSDKFFLWLFEGPSSNQGDQSKPQMSSPFFRITNEPSEDTSSEVTTSTSSTTTQKSSSTTSEAPASTTSESSASATSAESTGVSSQESTGTIRQQPGETGSNRDPPEEPTANSPQSGGLSVGAQAGIGASAGVVALCAVIGLVFYIRHLKKRRDYPPHGQWGMAEGRAPYGMPEGREPPKIPSYPLELSAVPNHQQSRPAELH